jgi:hypothetical protein
MQGSQSSIRKLKVVPRSIETDLIKYYFLTSEEEPTNSVGKCEY